MNSNKMITLVPASEENQINRNVLIWLNSWRDKPVDMIMYEELSVDEAGMALSTVQGTYITKRYIMGGYQAECQYKIIYRTKPGGSMDKRLRADETLDSLGDWVIAHKEELNPGDGVRIVDVRMSSRSALFGIYENGDEDHQILMTLTYEVI